MLATALAAESPAIRVGISKGYGAEALVTVLNKEPDMKATLLSRFKPEALAECEVLIVTQRDVPRVIIRGAKTIREWVEKGGGALFLHDAVGYRGHMSVFREIGGGMNHPKLNTVTVVKEHPITRGLKVGQVFAPGFQFDHVIVEKGRDGDIIIGDEATNAVVVAGPVGKGRVSLSGMATGASGAPHDSGGTIQEPAGEELTVLLNMVRWLAGARRHE